MTHMAKAGQHGLPTADEIAGLSDSDLCSEASSAAGRMVVHGVRAGLLLAEGKARAQRAGVPWADWLRANGWTRSTRWADKCIESAKSCTPEASSGKDAELTADMAEQAARALGITPRNPRTVPARGEQRQAPEPAPSALGNPAAVLERAVQDGLSREPAERPRAALDRARARASDPVTSRQRALANAVATLHEHLRAAAGPGCDLVGRGVEEVSAEAFTLEDGEAVQGICDAAEPVLKKVRAAALEAANALGSLRRAVERRGWA